VEQVILALLIVNLVLLLSVAVLTLRSGRAPEVFQRLAEAEQRLREGVESVRQGIEAALRDSASATSAGQQRLSLELGNFLGQRLDASRLAQDRELGEVAERFRTFVEKHEQAIAELRQSLTQAQAELAQKLLEMGQAQQEAVQARLGEIQRDNTEKLEKMRATVEEKLQTTIEARLGESFRTVHELLARVHQGLGDMQNLAAGVGDLKRVLTNVKARGTFGETQLAALLEEILTPEQFERNVMLVPGSREAVDFAVKLPGPDDESGPVYLPIDAKFPTEEYDRLQQAYEAADPAAAERARRALREQLLCEAKAIRAKYITPPRTTDFALLFLCTEGLYAEALRIPGLFEALQAQHVNLVGPVTLAAFLNSLRVGFRTLALQKRSAEVWRILAAVKTEFGKFGDSLEAVKKKLQEAANKVEQVSVRNRQVARALKNVESLPEAESTTLLPPEEAPSEKGGDEAGQET
jgi:DNA recombination protein RmuC